MKFNWWGSADPAAVYPEIAGSVDDPRPWLLESTDTDSVGRGFQGDTTRIALDAGSDAGDAADDSYRLSPVGSETVVKQAGTSLATGPFTAVGIYGSGDRDELVVESTSDPVSADVRFFPGGGNDELLFDDSARSVAESYELKPGSVKRGGAGAGDASFDGATEAVEIRGGSAGDAFDVTPSPDTIFSVHGNDPSTAPGDQLSYRTEGRVTTRNPLSGPDGQYAGDGVENVLFTGIEFAALIVPPPAQPGPSEPGPGPGIIPPQPDPAPLLSALRLSRTRIGRRGTRPRPVPNLAFNLSEAASVEIRLERRIKGRRVGTRCSPRARSGRRCTTYRKALTSSAAGQAGANRVRLPARVRTLPRGIYQLRVVATDAAGQKSVTRRATLTITR